MANPALDTVSAQPLEQSNMAPKLLDDTLRPAGDTKLSPSNFSTFNVDRQTTDDGGTLTRYPNGVKVGTGEPAVEVVPPPGGNIGSDSHGNTVIYDSKHRVVANMDKDRTVHVHTKNGDYTETADGKITFKPSGHTPDLHSLHKAGDIPSSKYEDYGVSSDGKTTRFPNGIEYDPKSGQVTIPPDYPNFKEVPHTDKNGNVTSRSGYDANGKLLYTQDGTGIHVPTADGTLSQNHGGIKFQPTETAGTKSLPKVDITDPLNPESPCFTSKDPLCGLDLGKY